MFYHLPSQSVNCFGYPFLFSYCFGKIATSATDINVEGSKANLETSAAPLDMDDTIATASTSQGGTPDEIQKQSSETDAGHDVRMEADADGEADAETGMIDGETDAEADLEAVS